MPRVQSHPLASAPIRLDGHRMQIAIGDVHGHHTLLAALLDRLNTDYPQADVTFLGDLIDRGPDSIGALALAFETVLSVQDDNRLARILPGNHEQLLLGALSDPAGYAECFLYNGGGWIKPYLLASQPDEGTSNALRLAINHALHTRLGLGGATRNYLGHLAQASLAHQVGNVVFVHAGIKPGVADPLAWAQAHPLLPPLCDACQPLWIRQEFHAAPRPPGMVVVHGHTHEHTIRRLDTGVCADPGVFSLDQGRLGLDGGSYATHTIAAAVLMEGAYQVYTATDRP